jgi:hypothetical protein
VTWSNGFCDGRNERGALVEKGKGPMAEKCCCNDLFKKDLGGRDDEDKRRQENGQT